MKRRHSQFVSRRKRRGVLLLVVLSLLTLFLLLGTTFLVTGNQYRTATKVIDQANRTTFQPADLLERALMQLVRDTNNANSVIRYHSLLRDQYGVDGFVARPRVDASFSSLLGPGGIAAPHFAGVTTGTAEAAPRGPTDGQVVEFYVVDQEAVNGVPVPPLDPNDRNTVGLDYDENGLPLPHELPVTDDYYNGCLLTFLEGPCRGDSVRVLDYAYVGRINVQDRVARLRVMTPRRADGARLEVVDGVIADLVDRADERGFRFMINGRPFNGMGVGFNPLALSSSVATQPLPRLSALELIAPPGSVGGALMAERSLIPNPVNFVEPASVFLLPQIGLDPWNEPNGGIYDGSSYAPLTQGFVESSTANYDPATSPLYKTFAGPGDADESYDAPDYQNMALASQALEPRFRARVVDSSGAAFDPELFFVNGNTPAYVDLEGVTIPSFHRPALANFWLHRLMRSAWLRDIDANRRLRVLLEPYLPDGSPQRGINAQQAAQIVAIKRKYLLRPLRDDHPDFDGSNPLSHYGSGRMRAALDGNAPLIGPGPSGADSDVEVRFPHWEAAGPWDVDNDGDGVPDSIWVDIGLPVQQTEDGRWYKPLVAMLVEDLDGRLNLNAHGSRAELAGADLDASTTVGSSGTFALKRNLAQDLYRNAITPLRSSDQLPEGAGWGPPETSLRPILSPGLPLAAVQNTTRGGVAPNLPPLNVGFLGNASYDDYARLLYGRPDPEAIGLPVDAALDVSIPFGRYGTQAAGLDLRSPGKTVQPNSQATNPLSVVAPTVDDRTGIDFRGDPLADNATPQGSYATPPDFYARYASAIAATGGGVRESGATWGVDPLQLANQGANLRFRNTAVENTPNDSPYELNLFPESRRSDPASLIGIESSLSSTPLVDDAPFAAAELERILRAYDADADKLPNRLWDIVNAFDGDKLAAQALIEQQIASGAGPAVGSPGVTNSLQKVAASTQAAINRRVVTTDSWDLPTPNENWTDRLILGADGLPGIPWTDRSEDQGNPNSLPDGVQTPGTDLGDDDGDGFFDEGDEAIAHYDASGSHTFRNAAGALSTRTYDVLWQNGCDDYVVVMLEDPPSPGRLIDYMRYRITLELLRRDNTLRGNRDVLDRHVQEILYGANRPTNAVRVRSDQVDNRVVNMTGRLPLFSFGGLLAPEVLAGRRMDLNRPFGDGRDNNNDNGVVDEMSEAGEPFVDINNDGMHEAGEPYLEMDNNGVYTAPGDFVWYDANRNGVVDGGGERRAFKHTNGADANGRGAFVDGNGNGVFDTGSDALVNDDGRLARQLFARHLYCLMMALVDEKYLAPYDPDDPQMRHYLDPLSGQFLLGGDPAPESSVAFRMAAELFGGDHTRPLTGAQENARRTAINEARQRAMRKLTARQIAQWCVNVVDFRDPDAIQTPFEYDENPWDGWNVVDYVAGNVRPLDGDLTTDEDFLQFRGIDRTGFGLPTPAAAALNPNAVRQIDRTRGVVWGAERPELLITEGMAWHDRRLEDLDGSQATDDGGQLESKDDDLDQRRKPKGHAYLELYNPWVDGVDRPAELYSYVDRAGAFSLSAGVRLDRLSNTGIDNSGRTRSPVWRISCVEEHPLLRNSTVKTAFRDVNDLPTTWLASDDPAMFSINDNEYPWVAGEPEDSALGMGPWLYPMPSDEIDDPSNPFDNPLRQSFQDYFADVMPGVTLNRGDSPSTFPQQPPRMLHSDENFWKAKQVETLAALATPGSDLVAGRTFELNVPVGVLETPPTPSDPSFPGFDRFAQPGRYVRGRMENITLSSRAHGEIRLGNEDEIEGERVSERGINRMLTSKPARFVERVFYPVAPATREKRIRNQAVQVADLLNPGYRIPDLSYGLYWPGNAPPRFLPDDPNGANSFFPGGRISASNLGDIETGVRFDNAANELRVSASKFLAGVDRFDLDLDGNRVEPLPLAPIAPGRRAVIGAVGEAFNDMEGGNEPRDFFGRDAQEFADRYVTAISQVEARNGEVSSPSDGAMRSLRRLEMQPSPDPNRHQFAIRMNGGVESVSVLQGGGPFNVTAGEAYAANQLRVAATLPVVAVPVDGFSISEPLDEYLIRQIELEVDHEEGRVRYAQQSIVPSRYREGGPVPGTPDVVEEYFSVANQRGSEGYFFDEPFDLLPELIENQTTPNYRTMHLERLANPLLPWNPPPRADLANQTDWNGQPLHNPALPVNPYLPVDSHSLDLTAFNSFTDRDRAEAVGANGGTVEAQQSEQVNVREAGDPAFGSEARHRRSRPLPGSRSRDPRPAINFASGERTTKVGPFAALWAREPSRLLWRQRTPSTTTDLTHPEDPANANRLTDGDRSSNNLPGGFAYDQQALDARYPDGGRVNFDFPLVSSLGFASRFFGEFHVASGLRWMSGAASPLFESYEIDGLANFGQVTDLIERLRVNDPYVPNGGNQNALAGTGLPAQPDALADNGTTPLFHWPNRPFVSAGELLQVPAWNGTRNLKHFSVFDWLYTTKPNFRHRTQVNPYNGEARVDHDGLDFNYNLATNTLAPAPGDRNGNFADDGSLRDNDGYIDEEATNEMRFRESLGHFGHLLNFFQTSRFPAFLETGLEHFRQFNRPQRPTIVPRGAAHYYRLLDYVTVPSRFTATATALRGDTFGPNAVAPDDPRNGLLAPFDSVDRYREPGRINLNTIVGQGDPNEPRDRWAESYDGLMRRNQDGVWIDDSVSTSAGYDLYNETGGGADRLLKIGQLGPAWRDVSLSRRGYVDPAFDPTQANAVLDYSSRRMHPDFPTLFANPFRAPGEGANVPLASMVQTGVDATLLRSHPLSPGADGAWGVRGEDDRSVNKTESTNNDTLADRNGLRDDADEAGVLGELRRRQAGVVRYGTLNVLGAGQSVNDRLIADVVLSRFDPTTGRRGALQDSFLEDAYRADANVLNPRNLAPSSSNNTPNVEISKRGTPVPLFSGATIEPSLDTERNAAFRYGPIQKMASQATTRSGVYAVWITVGYFEVRPAQEDARIWPRYMRDNNNDGIGDEFLTDALQSLFYRVYHEGWTLGQELDLDTGQNRRSRGFYIVDRTLPVAFRPGEDANVSEAILLRRRIE